MEIGVPAIHRVFVGKRQETGDMLLDRGVSDALGGVPDYNAEVRVEVQRP